MDGVSVPPPPLPPTPPNMREGLGVGVRVTARGEREGEVLAVAAKPPGLRVGEGEEDVEGGSVGVGVPDAPGEVLGAEVVLGEKEA